MYIKFWELLVSRGIYFRCGVYDPLSCFLSASENDGLCFMASGMFLSARLWMLKH